MTKGIFFGADYYPEHWPRERWETDARLMQEMGLDVVRMAEFAWAKMEPVCGTYDFDWLEDAVELLASYGIKSILGTPSAAPPAWLVAMHPEVLPVDSTGVQCAFGGRHHDCQSNADYHAHVARMVTAMAERFGGNENVIGWQIDNELGNSHDDLCFCTSCTARYQQWLADKYGGIAALNAAWGTHFWSQDYNGFTQISAPKHTVAGRNPSAVLDWTRFCSDLIVDFQQVQIDILRGICPHQFITHNCMGFADKVNYFDLGANLDFISHDHYPSAVPAWRHGQAAALDLMRGVKNMPFWVMEQKAGAAGWETIGGAPRPGELALWAQHSIAHGADTIVFFRWRTCTVGTEQYWHGILPHSGKPGRRYAELKALVRNMRPVMARMQGGMPRAEAAIVYSYDQNHAFKIQPQHPELNYQSQVQRYYEGLYAYNTPVDFVSDRADFSKYKLLVAPLQYLMTPGLAAKYAAYVENGGHLVLTMRAGVKDAHNICQSDHELPGLLADLAGVEVPDYETYWEPALPVEMGGEVFAGSKWCDHIAPVTAEVLARYASEWYAGTAAVTMNRVGKGRVYYVGTEPDSVFARKLAAVFIENANVRHYGETPEGVEITHRHTDGVDFVFILNHSAAPREMAIPAGWVPVLAEDPGTLSPFAVQVYCV